MYILILVRPSWWFFLGSHETWLPLFLALPNAGSTDKILVSLPSMHPFNAIPSPFQNMNQYVPVLETTKCSNTGQKGQQRLITNIVIDNSKTTHVKLKFLSILRVELLGPTRQEPCTICLPLNETALHWNGLLLCLNFVLFCFVLRGWLESPHKKSISSYFMWFVPHPESILLYCFWANISFSYVFKAVA